MPLCVALIQLLNEIEGVLEEISASSLTVNNLGSGGRSEAVLKRSQSTTWNFIYQLNCITAINDSDEYMCVLICCAHFSF